MYKFGIRYYDPTLGRWTQQDPLAETNFFIYANADPINLKDPSGAFTISLCANAIAGVGIGGLASACAAVGYSSDAGFSAGFTESVGGVGYAGIGGSAGGSFAVSNANRVSDLAGPFVVSGITGGFLGNGGVEGFVGPGGIGGGGGGLGVGGGYGFYGGATNTWVQGG